MLKFKTYTLKEIGTVDLGLLRSLVNQFWSDVFAHVQLVKGLSHLKLICKVEFIDGQGYRCLSSMERVNYRDKEKYIKFLNERLGILSDSYSVTPASKVTFTYIEGEGEAPVAAPQLELQKYVVHKHSFNNLQLPLTMNVSKYGNVVMTEVLNDGSTKYLVIENKLVFLIVVSKDGLTNHVHLTGVHDIKWVDTKLSDNTFKRVLAGNTFYVKDGIKVVSSKELPAKPFAKAKLDKKLLPSNTFMTIDVETVRDGNNLKPYLICGYFQDKYIHSYAEDLTEAAIDKMFKDFITKILSTDKSIKYVYAHNLAGFDGVFLLKELLKYSGAKVDPIIFNGKLIAIKFTATVNNVSRTFVFKDSYLLLPSSLRQLCDAFGVPSVKGHFPFNLTDINYVGEIPAKDYWPDITDKEYIELSQKFIFTNWDFRAEAIKYCYLDCKSLFEILVKFNELVFEKFHVNIHKPLTLPSLAMKIYKSSFMPENTIFQLLGNVEKDIRESYTGGAVDVYIPTNLDVDTQKMETLNSYDAVSLYPSIMQKLPMPVGKPIAFEGDITEFEQYLCGFAYCEITSPDYLEHPILQRRIRTKDGIRTVAGLGSWTGWVTGDAIQYCTKLGY